MTEPVVDPAGEWTPDSIDTAAAGIGIVPLFQPIVSLSDGTTVGYEALARWPALAHLSPSGVFERAAVAGCLGRLDRACTLAALSAALRAGLGPEHLLMVNCEPGTDHLHSADDELTERASHELQLVFEITERSLLPHPHTLLLKVAAARSDGFAVALDDVGARPDSLALLDLLEPEVIKLDIDLVQSRLGDPGAKTIAGVLAHQERTGAVIVAEGVETDGHLEHALALGATLGQGFLFGAAAPLPPDSPAGSWSMPTVARRKHAITGTPFDVIRDRTHVRTARTSTLVALSNHVETLAAQEPDPLIILTAVQHARHFRSDMRERYRKLAKRSVLVAVFGREVPRDLAAGIRGVALDSADPLCNEWVVIALGPHTSAALIAREQPGSRSAGDRRFDMVLTYDRELVASAARVLMHRMV